jgi:hypothetical protein
VPVCLCSCLYIIPVLSQTQHKPDGQMGADRKIPSGREMGLQSGRPCMKTQHVVPHAGKKHANYKTVELPHAMRRLSPTTTNAQAIVTSGSANTGAAEKTMKRDEGRLADYCMKTQHVFLDAGTKHANSKTVELPHAEET